MARNHGLRLHGVSLARAGSVFCAAFFFACMLSRAAADAGDCRMCLTFAASDRMTNSPVTKDQCDRLAALMPETWPDIGNAAFACTTFSGGTTPALMVCASTLDAQLIESLVQSFKLQDQDVLGSSGLLYRMSTSLDQALAPDHVGTGQRTVTLEYRCLGGDDGTSTTKTFTPAPPEPLVYACMTALTTARKASSGGVSLDQCNDLGMRMTNDWVRRQLPDFTGSFTCTDIRGSSAPQLTTCHIMSLSAAQALLDSFRTDEGTAEALSGIMDQALPDAGGPNRLFTLAYSCNGSPADCNGVPSGAAVVATKSDMLDGPTCNLCLTVSITGRTGQPAIPAVTSAQCSALASSVTVDWLSRGLVAAFRCSSAKGTAAAPELKLCSAVAASVAPRATALFGVDAASIKKAMAVLLTKALKSAGASRTYKLDYTCGSGGASGSATIQAEPQDCPVDALSGCYGDGKVLVRADCNGDVAADYTCTDVYGAPNQMTAISSDSFCMVAEISSDGIDKTARLCTKGDLKCPDMPGYTAQANMDMPIDPTKATHINKGQTAPKAFASWDDVVAATAAACTADSSCRGFSSLGIVKRDVGATASAQGVCLYTRKPEEGCTEGTINGCTGSRMLLLMADSRASSCKYACTFAGRWSFASTDALGRCVVAVATPQEIGDKCTSATAIGPDTPCPTVAGYSAQRNMDTSNNDQNLDHLNDGVRTFKPYKDWAAVVEATRALCAREAVCVGFSSLGFTKRSMAATQGSPGTCLYTRL